MTNDINRDRDYYAAMYNDVIIPDELVGIHYKAAIKTRNLGFLIHMVSNTSKFVNLFL